MVLIDQTESGFASALVGFLAPFLNGAPASEESLTKGPGAELAKLSAKLGDAAEAEGALRALVAALGKHTADLPADDMIAAYALMWEVINTHTPADKPALALEFAKQMATCIEAKPEDRPAARLSVLTMLYDRVGKASPPWRYELLLPLVAFATASGQAASLPQPTDLQHWLGAWGCDRAKRLAAYAACADCALKLSGEAAAQHWLLLLLIDMEGASAAELAVLKPRALAALAAALRSPTEFVLDSLAALPAVQQLAADAKHADAHKLLAIFAAGSLAEFDALVKAKPGVLAGLQLEPAAARRKMQLLTLISLARLADGKEIGFDKVGSECDVPADEAEELVLDAIAAGLMDARIDELRRVVRVGRCIHRQFGPAEWRALHDKLGEWKVTMQSMLEVVGTAPVAL